MLSIQYILQVALFTRAWIEMFIFIIMYAQTVVALFTRAWIEIIARYGQVVLDRRRPLHEGVD